MNDAAAEARRAYQRKWSKENRNKVKLYQERYWARKAQQAMSEKSAQDKANNESR